MEQNRKNHVIVIYRNFGISLWLNRLCSDKMVWHSCYSISREPPTTRTWPVEVPPGLQDDPKVRKNRQKIKKIFLLKLSQNHLKRIKTRFERKIILTAKNCFSKT